MQDKVDTITTKLLKETNLVGAIAQTQAVTQYLDALQNNTALWGADDYECSTGDIETKEDFMNSDSYGKAAGFYFFPGMCVAAQEVVLETARTQTCMEEFCNVGKVVDSDSILPENGEITGLDELQNSLNGIKGSADNLSATCKGCPDNNWEPFGAGVGALLGSTPKLSAAVVGKDELVNSINDADKALDSIGVEAATVTYGYKNNRFAEFTRSRVLTFQNTTNSQNLYRTIDYFKAHGTARNRSQQCIER